MAKNLEISLLLDFYGPLITEKQRELTEQYYNDDLSLSEIAQIEGITRQGVRDAIKRAEQQLLQMETELGMVSRFRKIGKEISSIAQIAEKIIDENNANGGPVRIDEYANEILQKAAGLRET